MSETPLPNSADLPATPTGTDPLADAASTLSSPTEATIPIGAAAAPRGPDYSWSPTTEAAPALAAAPDVAWAPSIPAPGFVEAPPAPKKRKTGLIVGAGVLALALIGGGLAWGLNLFGGAGPQPSMVLPSNTVGYVSFDLNPSPVQKFFAAQYLAKFPSFSDVNVGDGNAIKRRVFDEMMSFSGGPSALDYDADVKPWLGDRFALAAIPGGSSAVVVGLAQVTDRGKAEAVLPKLNGSTSACRVDADFLVCTTTDSLDRIPVTPLDSSLAKKQTFVDDLGTLHADAVGTAWADMSELVPLGTGSNSPALAPSGRLVMALQFADGNTLQLTGIGRGAPALPTAAPGTQIDKLSKDTIAAIAYQGLGPALTRIWPVLEESIPGADASQFTSSLGITVPDELAALLGDHTTVALRPSDGSAILPRIALVTDGEASIAHRFLKPTLPTVAAIEQEGIVAIAASETDARAAITGGLAAEPAFMAAVPKAAAADFVAYFDVGACYDWAQSRNPFQASQEKPKDLDVIQAFGVSSESAIEPRITMRLTLKG